MSNSLCYRCGELFDKGHLLKCKAINRQCFTCQRVGHLSKQCRNSGTKHVIVFVKRKSEHKKERDQKRWTEFKSRRESAMEFPFYNVESRTEFEFAVNSLCPSSPANHDRKRTKLTEKVRSFTKTILSQQEHLKSLEDKLSNAWKTSKDEKQRKKVQVEGLEDKLNDARTKNKALEKKIGKLDAEIYELKTDLQSIVDRLRVKACQLNFIQLAPRYPAFQLLYRRNTDSSSRKVSDVYT